MKVKKILSISVILGCGFFSGCTLTASQLGAQTTSEEVTDRQYSFTYDVSNEQLTKTIINSVDSLGWVKLEEHHDVLIDKESGELAWKITTRNTLTSEFEKSWGLVSPDNSVDDLTFIKVRTPMNLFSYGAEIYIGVSSLGGRSTVKYSGSTTQISEKSKMSSYLVKISSLVSNSAENLVFPNET